MKSVASVHTIELVKFSPAGLYVVARLMDIIS